MVLAEAFDALRDISSILLTVFPPGILKGALSFDIQVMNYMPYHQIMVSLRVELTEVLFNLSHL